MACILIYGVWTFDTFFVFNHECSSLLFRRIISEKWWKCLHALRVRSKRRRRRKKKKRVRVAQRVQIKKPSKAWVLRFLVFTPYKHFSLGENKQNQTQYWVGPPLFNLLPPRNNNIPSYILSTAYVQIHTTNNFNNFNASDNSLYFLISNLIFIILCMYERGHSCFGLGWRKMCCCCVVFLGTFCCWVMVHFHSHGLVH